jgi:hypothetical protein
VTSSLFTFILQNGIIFKNAIDTVSAPSLMVFSGMQHWKLSLPSFSGRQSSQKRDISVVYYLLTEAKFLILPTLKKQKTVFFNSHSNTPLTEQFKVKFGTL